MVSIGKLAKGQATYYLQQAGQQVDRPASIASGADDYYLGGPEDAGEWIGSLPGRLGAAGTVEPLALRRVLEGRAPATGEMLPRRALRVPGFDVTFSAPKSVSVLFGIGDDRVRRVIQEAHDAAVRDAFAYVERESARARRGHGGQELIRGDGLIAAAFRHRTSRAGDPQLHTHVLVANLTRSADGIWRALDGRRLYAHAKTAGYLYEARLRALLTRRLGLRWDAPRNGIADVVGVPDDVIRAFSRRRQEIEKELARLGHASARAAEIAALETRRRKDPHVTPELLAPEWRDRAGALGFDPRCIESAVLRRIARPPELAEDVAAALGRRLAGPEGLTGKRSTFARRDAVQAWCEAMPAGTDVSVEEIEAHVDALLRSEDFVPLLVPRTSARSAIRRRDGRIVSALRDERLYTSRALLASEQRIVARAGETIGAPTASAAAVRAALAARPALSGEQQQMVVRLTSDRSRVSVVVGKAGAGKTYALDAARAAWDASRTPVFGAAVARRAARELEEGSGIVSTSVAALLADLDDRALRLPRGAVVVVDEASLLPTRELARLLEHIAVAEGKLVLVGDHRQLPAIQAGGAFLGLAGRLGAIEMHENRRQAALWEREALDMLQQGRSVEALRTYALHDRLVVGEDAGALRSALVQDWWRGGDVGDALMIAFRRADVRELNARARALMLSAGRLDGRRLNVKELELAVGERVVMRRNDRRLGVANGDRGTVVAVDAEAGTIEVATAGRRVRLGRAYLAGGLAAINHGYAVTGHLAQGMTVDRALVLGTDTLFQEWGYVAMSRGRTSNRFYAVAGSPERDEFAPSADRRSALRRVTESLATSRAELMALDTDERTAVASLTDEELDGARDRLHELSRLAAYERDLDRVRSALSERVPKARPHHKVEQQRRAALREWARELEVKLELADPSAVARARCVDAELRRRRRLGAAGRRLVATPEMQRAIGPRPERPAELERWRRRAAPLDRHRGSALVR